MSAGEDAVRAGMADDVERQRDQIEMLHGSRELLTSILRNELRDEVRIGVAEGIAAAMTDEAAERFWAKGLEVLQRQATERTGRFVLGGLTAMLKKLAWAAVLATAIYSVGGWSLVKAMWAATHKG
jgi:hypothetical protein